MVSSTTDHAPHATYMLNNYNLGNSGTTNHHSLFQIEHLKKLAIKEAIVTPKVLWM